MDFIKTWEEQLAFLESQAEALRSLIRNHKALMGGYVDKKEEKNEKAKLPKFNANEEKPINILEAIFEASDSMLNRAQVAKLYIDSTEDQSTNTYKILRDHQPSTFSTIKFNNDNQKVYWILSKSIVDNKFNESLRPNNIQQNTRYEINPKDLRIRNKKSTR